MGRITRLQRIRGRYRFRARVPEKLRSYFGGRWEVVFSLRTADYDEARLRVMRVSVAFERRCQAVRARLRAGLPPEPYDDAWLHAALGESSGQADADATPPPAEPSPDAAGENERTLLRELIQTLQVAALGVVGRSTANKSRAAEMGVQEAETDPGPTLEALFRAWEQADPSRPPKSVQTVRACLDEFRRITHKRHALQVTRADFQRYVQSLQRKGNRPKTIGKKVGLVGAVFNHAVKVDLLSHHPGRQLFIPRPKLDVPSRAPFDRAHLQAILDSSFFVPRRGRRRRTAGYRWMILLALYQGARLEELAQLRLEDVVTVNDVLCLRIDTAESQGQRLKNSASRRLLPVHRVLVEVGFPAYVETLRRAGCRRLFPEFPADHHGRYGSAFSKAFIRLLRKELGILESCYVFHSFRHTFEDACREAELDAGVIDALMGHAANFGRGYQYGNGLLPE